MQDPQRPGLAPGLQKPARLLARIARSLGPREATVGRRRRSVRAIPFLAVGALGLSALQGTLTDRTATLPATLVEVDPLASAELPLEVNERVEKWMRRFLTDQRKTFETFLSREGTFAPMIRAKLRERGMPEDILYLAMIESGFSTRATSHVGAGGVWQFMRPTAKEYGLRIDHWVDERRDPVKATDAALDYLQMLHERYQSWYLAAAAYNAGYGRVDRALKKHAAACVARARAAARRGEIAESCEASGGESLYWEIIDQLPRETRDYVPKIIAATALAREAQRYGFRASEAAPYDFERVWVQGGTRLASLAREVGIELDLLKDLNPHLVRAATPPGASYALRVPVGWTERIIVALNGSPVGSRMAD